MATKKKNSQSGTATKIDLELASFAGTIAGSISSVNTKLEDLTNAIAELANEIEDRPELNEKTLLESESRIRNNFIEELAKFGDHFKLEKDHAVLASHVRRLVEEKNQLMKIIKNLEEQLTSANQKKLLQTSKDRKHLFRLVMNTSKMIGIWKAGASSGKYEVIDRHIDKTMLLLDEIDAEQTTGD